MHTVQIGKCLVSALCIGGNPFSGFSHQGDMRSQEMLEYYTDARIREVLRQAESLGINTFMGRTDEHVVRVLSQYWREGGQIQWFAQVCSDKPDSEGWQEWLKTAVDTGAKAAYIHGGIVDFWFANRQYHLFEEALKLMRNLDVAAGFAGHKPEAHEWIRDHLDVDFQMCCHYNPTDRSASPHHISAGEKWNDDDRDRMLAVIASISKPVIHYKVFAGGNKPIQPAFELLGRVMRRQDAVCMGMFVKDDPGMIRKNIAWFESCVEQKKYAKE